MNVNVNGHRQHNADNYPQYLLRSPSHGNFIMQSNTSSITNPTITRDYLLQQTFPQPISSIPSPPPPPPPLIPPPPPLPAQLLTTRSASWSTSQLLDSIRTSRSRADTNLCKFFIFLIY